jgi:hypothetical protein
MHEFSDFLFTHPLVAQRLTVVLALWALAVFSLWMTTSRGWMIAQLSVYFGILAMLTVLR